jgi:hypothetical protein
MILGRNPQGDQASHSPAELRGSKRMGEGNSRASGGASVGEVSGPSYAPSRGLRRGHREK